MSLRVLSFSAVLSFLSCRKIYDFAYNKAVYPTGYPAALTIGTGVHTGVEAFRNGRGLDAGLADAVAVFDRQLAETLQDTLPDNVGELRNKIERDKAKTRAMLRGYWERYHLGGPGDPPLDRELDFVSLEKSFHLPMINPRTGRASRTFTKAGRVDAIARLRQKPDAGLLVNELKTTSDTADETVSSLRNSIQPPTYEELTARGLGQPVIGTIVDVVKKPTIRGRKGESLGEFEDRCVASYRDEPDRFFRRVELAHDEGKIREAMEVFWQTARAIRESDRYGYFAPRGRYCKRAFGWCEYKSLCWYANHEGYRLSEEAHEELELEE
jgi:hypothetical protein